MFLHSFDILQNERSKHNDKENKVLKVQVEKLKKKLSHVNSLVNDENILFLSEDEKQRLVFNT